MIETATFTGLVSPKTGKTLIQRETELITNDGLEKFPIRHGIACLLDDNSIAGNSALRHEMEVFDKLQTGESTPFFREVFFRDMLQVLEKIGFGKTGSMVEMGGGQGHWAGFVKANLPESDIYVTDLSTQALRRAPGTLHRVFADMTGKVFEQGFLDMVSFWVSLHHLDRGDIEKTLREAFDALKTGGYLLVFEPNSGFFPRSVMYKTKLSQDVYFDENEKAIDFDNLSVIAKGLGFEQLKTTFLNPPYNINFIKKLKRWYIYFPVVEFLHTLDRLFLNRIVGTTKYTSLYGLAIYRKVI
ncbi:methyltransferase domain-containing protein [Candidatus Magnetomonas plexicatena]|uniref:methyltransferase domain-containing protein n=1 Tax=Candidatus Magnetomonas plexicatena TaxID=2552947 RepID=UPI0010FFE786|nr:class I SAM-dependent methyltransferase [Nitrospirales bacterium LBB_01]